ncbi:MAG TPA: DnaJ domain-containing protein [Amoebophilaceae bacterium]|nr:DnaJ domain-containing protein [Amoebophilaceae bacterium]
MKYNQAIQRLCLCVAYLAVVAANCSQDTTRPPIGPPPPTNHDANYYKKSAQSFTEKQMTEQFDPLTQPLSDGPSTYERFYAFPEQWEASKAKEDAKWEAFWNQNPAVWKTLYEKNDQAWIAFWEKKKEEFVRFWKTAGNEWNKFFTDAQHIRQALYTPHPAALSTRFWDTYQKGLDRSNALNGIYQEAGNRFNQKMQEKDQARVAFWKAYEEAWNKQQQAERERTQQKAYENKDTLRQERKAYAVLGLPMDAPLEEVKKAYRKLALTYHPDKQHEPKEQGTMKEREEFCNEKMKEINWARNTIEAYLVNNKETKPTKPNTNA